MQDDPFFVLIEAIDRANRRRVVTINDGSPGERSIPQGTSCSFLHAVTQALHSMQRSASQRNFALAAIFSFPPYATEILQRVAFVSCICVTES